MWNEKLKNTRKTQAIVCKDFILARLRLVSVLFAVYEFLSGNMCGNYNIYYLVPSIVYYIGLPGK